MQSKMLSLASRTGQDQIPLYNSSLFKYINTTYQTVKRALLMKRKRLETKLKYKL